MLDEKIKNEIIKQIKNCADVEKIIIYGSRARNENKPYSDIDIAIIFRGNLAVIKDRLNENIRTLLKFDIHDYNELPEYLRRNKQ